jgi:hypothetical protein
MGMSDTHAKEFFRKVERATVATRLLTIVSDSYELNPAPESHSTETGAG